MMMCDPVEDGIDCQSPKVEVVLYDEDGNEIPVKSEGSKKYVFTIQIPINDESAELKDLTCAYVTTEEQRLEDIKEAAKNA